MNCLSCVVTCFSNHNMALIPILTVRLLLTFRLYKFSKGSITSHGNLRADHHRHIFVLLNWPWILHVDFHLIFWWIFKQQWTSRLVVWTHRPIWSWWRILIPSGRQHRLRVPIESSESQIFILLLTHNNLSSHIYIVNLDFLLVLDHIWWYGLDKHFGAF